MDDGSGFRRHFGNRKKILKIRTSKTQKIALLGTLVFSGNNLGIKTTLKVVNKITPTDRLGRGDTNRPLLVVGGSGSPARLLRIAQVSKPHGDTYPSLSAYAFGPVRRVRIHCPVHFPGSVMTSAAPAADVAPAGSERGTDMFSRVAGGRDPPQYSVASVQLASPGGAVIQLAGRAGPPRPPV